MFFNSSMIPFGKLTGQWKIPLVQQERHLQMIFKFFIFHCHVSFGEGTARIAKSAQLATNTDRGMQ